MKNQDNQHRMHTDDENMPCQSVIYEKLSVDMALKIFKLAERAAYKIKATTNQGSYSTDVDSFGCFFDLTQHHNGVIILQSLGPKGNTFIQDLWGLQLYPSSVKYI